MLFYFYTNILCLYFYITTFAEKRYLNIEHHNMFYLTFLNGIRQYNKCFSLDLESNREQLNKNIRCLYEIRVDGISLTLEFLSRAEYIFPSNLSVLELSNMEELKKNCLKKN
ncbi:hypothetical protein EHP00_1896 [Ecytonucleospora hepatopenaei]|uniref:Uncharacterized protein n=1 Tax=Ecytonucleospora hepatopenaei TaxID=646526 RepID=A0A1W0E323_9MICR|nr:hypothetical protein EHP00_1896 [Ecytonucleospora hepatopenaei]